jgi:hypothetical protein
MSEKRIKIPLPTGETVEGIVVSVENSTDPWAEVQLEDGVVLRLKNVIVGAVRLVDKFDGEGNPLYILKNAPLIIHKNVPETLKKQDTAKPS